MKSIFKSCAKWTVVILLLGILVGVAAYQAEPVAAAPPCTFCEARLDNCLEGCSTQACEDACYASVQGCFNVCI